MQITQKKKKSIWVWVLLLLALVAIIGVVVLSNLTNPDTGKAYIDLTPASNYWMGVFYWAVGGWTPEDAAMKAADPTYVFNYQIINSA